jgi:hypothetical protein
MRHLFFYIALASTFLLSCSKGDLELDESTPNINPSIDREGTLRSLMIFRGIFFDADILPSDTTFGRNWYLKTSFDTITCYEGIPVDLQVTKVAPGPYILSQIFVEMEGATGYWQLDAVGGIGKINLAIPSLVKSGKIPLLISGKLRKATIDEVDSFYTEPVRILLDYKAPDVLPVSFSGNNSNQIFRRRLNLGSKKGAVTVRFLSMDSSTSNKTSDRFDLKYNSKWVVSSARTKPLDNFVPSCAGLSSGAQRTQGFKEYTYDFNPDNGSIADLYVQGNCTDTTKGTSWRIEIKGP